MLKYAGSLFPTVEGAAARWATSALPDTSVIGPTEKPSEIATDLEHVWWSQVPQTPEDVGEPTPKPVDEKVWRDACREALVTRIFVSRENVLVAKFESVDRRLIVITTTGSYGPGRFTGYQIVDITHAKLDLLGVGAKHGTHAFSTGNRLGNPFGTANGAAMMAIHILLPPPTVPSSTVLPRGEDYLAGNERSLGMGPETGDK